MGAGKTTIGRMLAEQLRWSFVDLDDVIVQMEGQSIATLFATIGEAAFREREHAALKRVLHQSSIVLALGGGAVEMEANRTLLRSTPGTKMIFLEAPLEILVARCQQQTDAVVRPVLADSERLMQRYVERLPHYRRAHSVISTADMEPADVVKAILAPFHVSLKLQPHRR